MTRTAKTKDPAPPDAATDPVPPEGHLETQDGAPVTVPPDWAVFSPDDPPAAPSPRLTALYDPDGLRALVARIEAGQHHALRQQLVDELEDEGLLVLGREELADGTERVILTMCGLEVTSTAGIGVALQAWCNKVRRTLASGEPAPGNAAA